jgi:hypothetical protein
MPRMNSRQRKHRWKTCADRDGIRCNICKKPWFEGLDRTAIEAYAKKKRVALPADVADKDFMSRAENATGPFQLLAYKRLVIDHVNNNNRDNPKDGSNWQLAHQSCNVAKNPQRGRRGVKSLGQKQKEISPEKVREKLIAAASAMAATNEPAVMLYLERQRFRNEKKKFKVWINAKLKKYGRWEMQDTIYAGAELLDVSPQTTARWLRGFLSTNGHLTDESGNDGYSYIVFKRKEEENKVGEV